ncbi:MAG: hypothetical protein RL220_1646 [Bacteroidota bacterium]
MSSFAENLASLRKSKGFTQQSLADETGLNRSVIGAYEEGRAEPSIATLQKFAKLFGISVDQMIGRKASATPSAGDNLRVLTVAVDSATGNERISVVPVKAAAGYLRGYGDPEYIEGLPVFDLPIREVAPSFTYRLFQISGDSMLPIPSGSYVIGQFVDTWSALRKNDCYVFVTDSEGIVYKRLLEKASAKKGFLLGSDNPMYVPFTVEQEDVREIWKVIGYISFDLPVIQ